VGELEGRAEQLLVADQVVRRQDDHDLVVGPVDGGGREGDRRRGVAAGGLDDEPDARLLLLHDRAVAAVRDAIDVIGADERLDAPDGPLEEGLVAEQGQKGLGAIWPAQRPQAGPAAARQDDDVHRPHSRAGRRPRCPAGSAGPCERVAVEPGPAPRPR
jgi:hypothetical protein